MLKRNRLSLWIMTMLVLELVGLVASTRWGWPGASSIMAADIPISEGAHLEPSPWRREKLTSLPSPGRPGDGYSVDLRSRDLTGLNLSGSLDTLMGYATFDSQTRWPTSLPAGFDPQAVLEAGKNPGLGVRALHQQGITGQGVRIAFVDQSLLWDHQEYAGRVSRYFTVGKVPEQPEMHGAAVTSLLVGRTTGVAPGADLTYYAKPSAERNFVYLAAAINQVLDENKRLPKEKRIRAIGASVGAGPSEPGYAALDQAIRRAQTEGVLVVLTTMERWYPYGFSGMDRDPLGNPDDLKNYGPGSFYKDAWFARGVPDSLTFVPMDSRTTAGWFARDGYMYSRFGGESWSVPYVVGTYALVLQAAPNTTPQQFLKAAHDTGSYTTLVKDGKEYRFGPILNPAALINSVKGK